MSEAKQPILRLFLCFTCHFERSEQFLKLSVIARQFERSENNEASVRSTDPHLQIQNKNKRIDCHENPCGFSRNDEMCGLLRQIKICLAMTRKT
ncbi:hypothetical protein ACWIUD_12055 [Helicobacter sp. 23-1044]